MTRMQFGAQVRARGGGAEVWLVYLADPLDEMRGGRIVLGLQRAFWTRADAHAFAEASRAEKRWQQLYVFSLLASEQWSEGTAACAARFDTAFGRVRPLPGISVTPTDVAAAFDGDPS